MAVTIDGTTGVSAVQDGVVQTADLAADAVTTAKIASSVNLGRRNLIINGAMQVAQRGTSSTGMGTAVVYGTCDRWRFADSANPPARYTQTQSTDAPDGFSNSLKMEVTTADTAVDADELQNIDYFIEAQDLQHLGYGSSSAKELTLSFWVKCSIAQNFGFRLQHEDAGGSYTKSYTVNSANTWEYKTLTFPGNTSTNFANDNGRGFRLRWGMCAGTDHTGSDSTAWGTGNTFGLQENTWVATTGNTWQITGVQLEVGDTATPFEHRSYGEELALCQRYFERIGGNSTYDPIGGGMQRQTTESYFQVYFKQTKRTPPTVTHSGNIITTDRYAFDQLVSSITDSEPSIHGFHGEFTHTSVGADRRPIFITSSATSPFGYMDFDSEL